MRRIFLVILIAVSVSISAQPLLKTKYIALGSVGSSVDINLASNAQVIFVSGTKSLSAPFAIGVTGTPVDGKTILLFWDGTNVTPNSNAVTLLGVTITEKQVSQKLVALASYKTSAWETRLFRDAHTTSWVEKGDLDPLAFDTTTIELDPSVGIQIKDGGIDNTHIADAAGIIYSKLVLTNSVVAADISPSAAIPYSKLSLAGTIMGTDISTSAVIPWSKMALQTAGKVMISDGSGYATVSTVTPTELAYVSGVTSNIQTQINTARNGKTYTKTSAATVALDAAATDIYICNTTSSTISVTLPDAADFARYHSIVITRTFTGGSNAVTISPYSGNSVEDSTGADVASYSLSGTSGEGVEFASNGVDTWIYIRKW